MIVEKIDEKNSIQHQIFGVQYTHSDETMNAIKVVERKKKRGIAAKNLTFYLSIWNGIRKPGQLIWLIVNQYK